MSTSEIAKLESRWRDNPQGLTFAPLAEAYRKQKDPRRALEILQPGLERHPDYIPANIVLGRCHWDLGDLEAAERAFTQVLALDGENVIALKALADITERQSRPFESERWLEALLVVDRSNEEARDQLARIRAVQSVAPTIETPAGLEDEVGAPPPEPPPAAAADFAAAATDAGSPVLDDPFPAIADQIPRSERPTLETTPAAWVGVSDEDSLEPAAFADLGHSVESVEPTDPVRGVGAAGMEPRSEPEPVGSAEPPAFAAPPLPGGEAFGFERAEEIVLNVSTGTEFQTASATDDLVSSVPEPTSALPRDGDDPVAPPPGFQPEEMALEQEPDPEADLEPSSLSLDPPAPSALFGSYLPEAAAAAYEPPAFEAPSYQPPGYEAPVAESLPAGEPSVVPADSEPEPLRMAPPEFVTARLPTVSADPDPPDTAEPDLVVTETMAQVFLRQGHVVEGLAVYRELLARTPDSGRLKQRVAELEERQRVLSSPPPRPSFLARDTGGQSLGSFFAALLAARPERGGANRDDGSSAMELSPETAPATRPAQEPLSLGSVFGEDPPAATPAVPPVGSVPAEPAGASSGDPVSFDDFFAGAPVATPAPAPPTRPSRAKPDDDLDQFHSWLQGLKR
jgi:tetratricopeptide (TPR) repeat protein